jgi:UDP-N-acetylglucosamine 3-dehydrogenase
MRVAVLGLGSMGRNHVRVWAQTPGVELVGVADPSGPAVASALEGRSIPAFTSLDELLDRARPDALSIAVPTTLHEEAAVTAVRRGVHILLEKPVAPDVEAGLRIRAAVESAGVVAMVGHIERFNPALLELRRRVGAGSVGTPFEMSARRIGPFPSRIRDVGVVQDLATHDLDQIRYVLGREVEVLFAQTAQRIHSSHEDLVSIVGRAEGGVVLNLDVNWLSPRKVRKTVVIGAGGMLVADSLTQDLFLYENDYEDGNWRFIESLRGVSEGNMVRFALRRVEPLRAEIDAFRAAIRERVRPACTIDDGLAALRLAEAVLDSAARTTPCTLALPMAGRAA